MTTRRTRRPQSEPEQAMTAVELAARAIPTASVVMSVVVRVVGIVPVRLDLTHAGAAEQQLGLSMGTVLVYVRSAATVQAVAEQWTQAAGHARALTAAVVGWRPGLAPFGSSSIAALVRLAGIPEVTAGLHPTRPGSPDPTLLRLQVGPIIWEICDTTAYTTLLHGWQNAARLIGTDLPGPAS